MIDNGYRYDLVYDKKKYGLFHGQKTLLLKLHEEGKISRGEVETILFDVFEAKSTEKLFNFLDYPKIIGKYCFSEKGDGLIRGYITFLENIYKRFGVNIKRCNIEIVKDRILYKDEHQYCLEVIKG